MKYIMIVGDGMCDRAIKEFDGKTPLQVARIPNMNMIAKEGQVGIASTIPLRLAPASDVANLSLLGYDPNKYYTGRAPLEAANMGVELKKHDVGFRCNLVTISDEKMEDYSAGHINSKEAAIIIKFLDQKLSLKGIKFYPGVSYRHLTVINSKEVGIPPKDFLNTICTPPHDISGKRIARYLPRGKAGAFLSDLMARSKDILLSQDINKVRVDLGENPANMIWLWGQGMNVHIPKFKEKFHLTGSIISAVDLIKGIGKVIGLDVINVPGATGYYDTNYKGKAEYAIKSLEKQDFVFIHVEAPDEAGHNGDVRAKVAAIENIDRLVIGTILEHMQNTRQDFRILVTSDHATPVSVKTHTREPIFFAVYGKGIPKDEVDAFNEIAAYKASIKLKEGFRIIERLIK